MILGGIDMNHFEIKEKAKQIVHENLWNFWKGYLVVFAISFLCTFVLNLLLNEESVLYSAVSLVLSFFTATLSVGFYSYLMKLVRNEEYSKEDLFRYIGKVLPIAAIGIITSICVIFCSLFFIIPGIIVALGYAMSYYIYVDTEEEKRPMEYLADSKMLMQGYKWDYFCFMLSFFGWILVGILTFGIAIIWVYPYVCVSQVLYYDALKEKKSHEM